LKAYSRKNMFGGVGIPYGENPAIGPTPFDVNYQSIGPNKPPNGMDPSEMDLPKGSPDDPVEYIDSNDDNTPFNQNMYFSFDPTSQFVGVYTNVDEIRDSTKFASSYSDNPMDDNWGGVEWTRQSVESGKYDDDLVVPYNHANGFTQSSNAQKKPVNPYA